MVIWLVFGWWGNYTDQGRIWYGHGSWVLTFILLFLLGWHSFGFVIRGQ